jgi:hypothetical protein
MKYILLIISLPTQTTTERVRLWRSLKASGAAVLRDGVYVLPQSDDALQFFNETALHIDKINGSAHVLEVAGTSSTEGFELLFDRSADYETLLQDIAELRCSDSELTEQFRLLRKLRKTFKSISDIDFFPGSAKNQTDAALTEMERMLNKRLTPGEPNAVARTMERLSTQDFNAKVWATRARPWVDRMACCWLILRFIDPQASFLWFTPPEPCPEHAIGFDFDGARFSHHQHSVTFEVLLQTFALETPALLRMAQLVHFLDVGGNAPEEAFGVEHILWGLRNTLTDDDQLVLASHAVFDALLTSFTDKG